MRNLIQWGVVLLAVFGLTCTGSVHAALLPFTSEADFLAAIFVDRRTLDFESLPANTLLPSGSTIDGITLTYSIGGLTMKVTDAFAQTTSGGTNALGLDVLDEAFLSGDSFIMTFDQTIHALGLFVIGSPGDVLAGDFALSTGAGSVFNVDTPDRTVADGGEAFFLGLVATDASLGFTSAMLESFDPQGVGLFVFNVDDITTALVPEPGTLVLLGTGLGVVFWWRRRAGQS